MIHPDTELNYSKESIGYGIFATKMIPRGTITWVFCTLDFKLTKEQIGKLHPQQHKFIEKHSFVDNQGCYILGWDIDKYCNHSCKPTTAPIGGICDIALRDIQKGEEITCDYGTCNIRKNLVCDCGVDGCRGLVRPIDLISLSNEIDKEVTKLIPLVNAVPQPLLKFMNGEHFKRLQSIIAGDVPIPSSLENAYDDFMGLTCTDSENNSQFDLQNDIEKFL